MQTVADGLEVVKSLEAPEASDAKPALAPLLVLDRLEAFLDEQGIGAGPIAWQRVGDGQSNLTYRLRRGGRDVVLRRGPRPPHPPSAHDMVREAAIQQLLRAEGVAVPEVLAVCDDSSVLGVPFYLMNWLDGEVVTDRIPVAMSEPPSRAAASRELVKTLARLHAVDVEAGPIAGIGRPAGYLERQVRRFRQIWEQVATRDLTQVETIASWLDDHRPTSQTSSVVHGDYRMGNVMFRRSSPVGVLAVLDWELATLGDPLADLGYLTATYADAESILTPLHLTTVTAQPGFLSSEELVGVYAEQSELDLSGLAWYQTLALWKAAIFCEAIYARWLNAERPGDTTFGPSLDAGVPALLRAADEYRRSL
ncbi:MULTISPECIES: phosphotransferase family protein [unclassified Nocardioides]|uniref:phosphotransferase family protein n=1 Tax=unclassified Nocardioides TaxID=2615069 RepID=UPI0036151FB0